MWAAVILFTAGAVCYFGLAKPSESEQVLLESDQSLVELCHSMRNLDYLAGTETNCDADEQNLLDRQTLLAKKAATFALPGMIMLGIAPFLFLVGLILFVAGRIENRMSEPAAP